MIIYDARKIGGYDILLHKTGSALFSVHSLPQALGAAFLSVLLSHLPYVGDYIATVNRSSQATTYFGGVSFVVGFILVYRMQLANERYRDAQMSYFSMAVKLHDMALHLDAFAVGCSDTSREVMSTLLRWLRLYHEMALEELQGFEFSANHPRTSLTTEEAHLLAKEQQRATRIMNWVYKLIVSRREVFEVGDAMLTRVMQLGGEANTNFTLARRVAETPFPFAFAQIAFTVIHLWAVLTPVAAAAFLGETYVYGAIVTFFSTWALFAVNEAAAQLENPFEDAANTFPLVYYSVAHNDNISAVEFMQVPFILAKGHFDHKHDGDLEASCPLADRYNTTRGHHVSSPTSWNHPLSPKEETVTREPESLGRLQRSSSLGSFNPKAHSLKEPLEPLTAGMAAPRVPKRSVSTTSRGKQRSGTTESREGALLRSSSSFLSPKKRQMGSTKIGRVKSGPQQRTTNEFETSATEAPAESATVSESKPVSSGGHGSVFDLFAIDSLDSEDHAQVKEAINEARKETKTKTTGGVKHAASSPTIAHIGKDANGEKGSATAAMGKDISKNNSNETTRTTSNGVDIPKLSTKLNERNSSLSLQATDRTGDKVHPTSPDTSHKSNPLDVLDVHVIDNTKIDKLPKDRYSSPSKHRRKGSMGELGTIVEDEDTEEDDSPSTQDRSSSVHGSRKLESEDSFHTRPLHYHAVADDSDAMKMLRDQEHDDAQANIARNYNTVGGVDARKMLDQLEFERALLRKKFALEAHNEFVRKRAQGERRRHTRKALSREQSIGSRLAHSKDAVTTDFGVVLGTSVSDQFQFTVRDDESHHSRKQSIIAMWTKTGENLKKIKETVLPSSEKAKKVLHHINSNPTELRMNGEFLRFT